MNSTVEREDSGGRPHSTAMAYFVPLSKNMLISLLLLNLAMVATSLQGSWAWVRISSHLSCTTQLMASSMSFARSEGLGDGPLANLWGLRGSRSHS